MSRRGLNLLKHGLSESTRKTYQIWEGMRQRCNNPRNPNFKWYGARGIKVCNRWNQYENFLSDMGEKPPGLSIGRINNDGDYEPSNCRWETDVQQKSNRPDNVWLEFRGQRKLMSHWAKEYGIKLTTLFGRIYIGKWSIEDALTRPVQKRQIGGGG